MKIPNQKHRLTREHIQFLEAFATSCRRSIIEMTTSAKSGHPGGSLGCIDYLSLLYTFILSQTGEKIVVSNGHISPAVYSVLAELGYIPKKELLKGFRRIDYPYEGHVSRLVPGVWYGTGPLGTGVSAASGFALAEKIKNNQDTKVFALLGDGESQEGQVYEMMNFAAKYKLNNLIVFLDYNQVQLSSSLKEIMPLNPKKLFTAAGWRVLEVDGHNFSKMWKVLEQAQTEKTRPVVIVGHTYMGKGVGMMEKTGKKRQATWHGKAASTEEAEKALQELKLTSQEEALVQSFRKQIKWKPKKPLFPDNLSPIKIKIGKPILYPATELTDCRTAYGKALLDLAKNNPNVVAMTADLADSVKTSFVKEAYPDRHIECGVAEQQMVSAAGGLSLAGFVPFCSTFGAFMTSRAKDQARVNDINHTNVKMVATHCGLSVGEDGPTHQAIDDMGSMLGLLHTNVIEPADPNHCDRIIRYVGSHYGNFYVRMGRHKIPVLTKEDGGVFFDEKYQYHYGRCDVLREGKDVTIVASGATVYEALKAREGLLQKNISADIIIVSSPKKFDDLLFTSIQKTKRLLVVEDHTTHSGVGAMILRELGLKSISVEQVKLLGVDEYQLSGTAEALYAAAEIDAVGIEHVVTKMLK